MPSRSPRDLWETALGTLQVQVSSAAYETWLGDTQGLSFDGAEFVIGVPNGFVAEWLQRRMHSLLERTLSDVLKQPVHIAIRVAVEAPSGAAEETAVAPPPPPRGYRPSLSIGQAPDPHLTFDTFVVGAGSQLAHAAANAVAESPGQVYNPLFLYGSPGLGKTHLLHAITHKARAHQRSALLTTAEDFVNDFITAIRERHTDEFRARYRSPDILILDDVQFICGKARSEESLLHTCNALFRERKQVILASDRAPSALPFTHRRLSSRFLAGLMVDLRPPDYTTRLAILGFKASRSPVPVPEEVLHYLAARPCPNVRQLEGDLTRVTALASLLNEPLTLDLATRVFGPGTSPTPDQPPSPAALVHAAAAYFHLSPEALAGKSRERTTTRARQITMHLLRTCTPLSLEAIGRLLGGRDHTTVLYGTQKIAALLSTDASISEAEATILSASPTAIP